MKSVSKLTPEFSITTQVALDELDSLVSQGYKTLINNRPDGEEASQPTSAEMERKATELGMVYRHIPVALTGIQESDIQALDRALRDVPSPVVSFCRSGTRSALLWQATVRPTPESLSIKRAIDTLKNQTE